MQLNLSAADYAVCVEKNSRVRYVVMDRVGISVFDYQRRYIGGRVPFSVAIHIGIEMMNALQLIHDQGGIQHNDCHYGNFVLDQHLRVKLIDFGRASYVENIPEGDEINPNAYGFNNPLLTPWEMEGLRPTRRDDVYRAIFAVAGMMNGSEFYSLFRRFNHLGAETFEVKSRRNFMLGAFGRTLFNQVKVRNPELVTAFLNQIVDLVMGTGMNDRPPYEAIRAILSQILDTRTMI